MNGYNKASEIITANRGKLEKLALALIDRETLNLKDIEILMADEESGSGSSAGIADDSKTISSKEEIKIKKDVKEPGAKGGADGLVGGGGLPDPSPA